MNLQPSLPTHDDLFEPSIKALKALGGSGNIQEIYDKVCELEGYSEEQQSILGYEYGRADLQESSEGSQRSCRTRVFVLSSRLRFIAVPYDCFSQ
jgi:hypothetical protein